MNESNTIIYREGNNIDAQLIIDLYRSAGLQRPIEDSERIRKMYEHANLVVSAWDGDQLVGIARSLSDYCYVTYLADLAVHIDYQKRGIGKKLMELTKELAGGPGASLILLAAPAAINYYPHVGFETMHNCFSLQRER